MKVIAIIGDIVASKAVARRDTFQRRLETTLAKTGDKAGGLASPYTITLGDEFQAVYRSSGTLWADVVDILVSIHPVRARFALGVGELSTRLNPDAALGMDGPAFHQARAKLTELKEKEVYLGIGGAEGESWGLANSTLAFVSHALAGWNQNRLKVLAGLLRERPVRELEAELRISRVAVYKNINAAALDEVVAICQELSRQMDQALSPA
jgi:hypothetical protein